VPLQNSKRQNGNMKQLPFLKPTNIRRHRAKFGCHSGLAPGIGASRITIIFFFHIYENILRTVLLKHKLCRP